MPHASKTDKIDHPQSHYATPDALIDDRDLSLEEKINALSIYVKCLSPAARAWREAKRGRIQTIDLCSAKSNALKDKLQRKLKT